MGCRSFCRVLTAVLIFALTYLVLAIGRLPGFQIDRTGACIIGAALMIACNVLSIQEAYAAIDYNTIILLFGMMIVVANLRLSGFFALVSGWVVEHAHRPLVLLAAIALVSGVFSAFFVNDTICLVLTPLVLEITQRLKRNAVPYLLAVAMAANVGSVATITGNPQNMMIGSFSGIGYTAFAAALAPVALAGLLIVVGILALVYRGEMRHHGELALEHHPVTIDRARLGKSLIAAIAMLALFFVGWPVAKVALAAGALLLITRRGEPDRMYQEINWPLLVMFIGLFIVVAGVEKTSLSRDLVTLTNRLGFVRPVVLSACAAILSNIVSNVPAVLVLKPIVTHLPDPKRAWLMLAMASTLAGNLTVLGSVANLIVVERSRGQAHISFWEYAKAGLPITLLTMGIGLLLLR